MAAPRCTEPRTVVGALALSRYDVDIDAIGAAGIRHLEQADVASELWGQRLFRSMLQEYVRREKPTRIALVVRDDNTKAKQAYARDGFVHLRDDVDGVRAWYVLEGEPLQQFAGLAPCSLLPLQYRVFADSRSEMLGAIKGTAPMSLDVASLLQVCVCSSLTRPASTVTHAHSRAALAGPRATGPPAGEAQYSHLL